MTEFVHIEPADEQRRDFARWALSQAPKLQTSSSTGTDVPVDLYPDVPPELLEGAFVDGFRYGGPEAPQPAAVATPKAKAAPASTEGGKGPQTAVQRADRKPRKRAPRRPRKAAGSKLTAETIASEAIPTGTDADTSDSGGDAAGSDSAGE
jgi:hypothetical protein